MPVIMFMDNEGPYLEWVRLHPSGYVINTEHNINPNYMVLHQAWCRTMSQYARNAAPGGFTERQYIKICGDDLPGLRDWVRQHGRPDGSFTSEHDCYR